MAKSKNRVVAALERARQSLTQDMLTHALAELPPSTTMGEVVASLKDAGLRETFDGLSLGDFTGTLGNGAPVKRGRKPGRPTTPQARRPAKAGKVNTRTQAGRAAYEAAVAQALSSAGVSGATELRGVVGGTAAQMRQALERLMEAGKASKNGQKRGTTYSWGAARKARKKAGSGRKTGKKAGRKAKVRGRKKKATRKSAGKAAVS